MARPSRSSEFPSRWRVCSLGLSNERFRSMYARTLSLRCGRRRELRRQFLNPRERAAGRKPRIFYERRVQQKGATVDERMVRGFKGFSSPPLRCRPRQQLLIELQVPLKIKRVARGPAVL